MRLIKNEHRERYSGFEKTLQVISFKDVIPYSVNPHFFSEVFHYGELTYEGGCGWIWLTKYTLRTTYMYIHQKTCPKNDEYINECLPSLSQGLLQKNALVDLWWRGTHQGRHVRTYIKSKTCPENVWIHKWRSPASFPRIPTKTLLVGRLPLDCWPSIKDLKWMFWCLHIEHGNFWILLS